MNKEQSADDPTRWILIRVKNMLNISMSYPDVVIACIEHKVSLQSFIQSNWGSVGEAR